MQSAQQRLWPDAQPLVERLGREFFLSLPERPGVYLMRDDMETVLYVGKAKNLRHRLGSYRVANPERMARRTLRLLRLVTRIELQECDDEQGALKRESELLRTLKPRFNRAGTWTGKPRFLTWRASDGVIEFAVTESPAEGWNVHGPLGGGASYLAATLGRLLWLAINRDEGIERLPAGWMNGRVFTPVCVCSKCGELTAVTQAVMNLQTLLTGDVESFQQWFTERRSGVGTSFENAWLEVELESMEEWFKPGIQHSSQPVVSIQTEAPSRSISDLLPPLIRY